jgi:copper chaperone CopZ
MNRTLTLYILTGAAFFLLLGCAGGNRTLRDETPANTEIRTYEVFGMDCPGCHGGVEKLVNKIEGIEASEANWEKKTLVVAVRKGVEVSDEKIEAAVREANFTPGERVE